MGKTKNTSAATIASARQLAGLVGRSKSAVADWVGRPDWPFGQPPWPVTIIPKVKRWMGRLTPSKADPEVAAARQSLLRAQLRWLNFESDLIRGKYVRLEDAKPVTTEAVVAAKNDLLRLGWHLHDDIAGQSEPDIRALLTHRVERIAADYAQALDKLRSLRTTYALAGPDGPGRQAQGERDTRPRPKGATAAPRRVGGVRVAGRRAGGR